MFPLWQDFYFKRKRFEPETKFSAQTFHGIAADKVVLRTERDSAAGSRVPKPLSAKTVSLHVSFSATGKH